MSEKKVVQITLSMEDAVIERLKSVCRAQGFAGLSATAAILKCIELAIRDEKAVKLLDPERKEIEGRSGATVPVRTSRDILRAFERMAGGPNAVMVDVDPALDSVMRDAALQLGWTYSELCKNVLQEAYVTQFTETVELRGVYFTARQWRDLLKIAGRERIRDGGELLSLLAELRRAATPEPAVEVLTAENPSAPV